VVLDSKTTRLDRSARPADSVIIMYVRYSKFYDAALYHIGATKRATRRMAGIEPLAEWSAQDQSLNSSAYLIQAA
jgi:hypothetical protein